MTTHSRFPPLSALALALASLLASSAQAQCLTPLQTFNYTGAIVSYPVSTTGDYWIEAAGAEGGNYPSSTYRPGRGAIVGGKFQLTAGTSLSVLVGQQPSLTHGNGNGGGGGSFVVVAGSNPPQALLVGGGGAGSAWSDSPGKHGQAGTSGAAGTVDGGAGGTAGTGGGVAVGTRVVAGGGGLLGDGAGGTYADIYVITTTGGKSFANGGAGGTSSNVAAGGFGGGGGGARITTSGGGGGYSGGGGGNQPSAATGEGMGGGGGSFNAGADPMTPKTGAAVGQTGHGYVKICSTNAPAAMAIAPTTLGNGVEGSAYGPVSLTASGGGTPYTWSAANLPSGMNLSAAGELSGTPASGTAGTYTITVSDAYQPPNTATVSWVVLAPVAISTSGSLPDATEGQSYSQTLQATGGTAPYTWALAAGSSLPDGLSLDASTGEISGTATKAAAAAGQAKAVGSFSFGVQASDSSNPQLHSAVQQLSIQVVAAPVVPATVTPVPTLGAWAMALLGLLTAGSAALGLRRRA